MKLTVKGVVPNVLGLNSGLESVPVAMRAPTML